MAKPSAPSTPPPAQPSFWIPFLMVGIVGALLGSTVTYLALRPQLDRAARASAMPIAANASMPADINHAPPADLTAGMPPAQAERTLGNFYYDHQNWPEAIRRYESAIKQGSDDADIRTDLGNAYRFSGRPQDALTQYELAQRMNPQHEFSLFNQGGLYFEDLKNTPKAIETWTAYLARFPNGTNAANARNLIAQASGAPAPLMPGGTGPLGAPSQPSSPGQSPNDQRLFDLINGAPKKP
ncbi:MAG: tetratricopeptide repeat protein [Opitutae bacterium]|nr:tetratricopeptide repeat protein [Opitutae bacterium]